MGGYNGGLYGRYKYITIYIYTYGFMGSYFDFYGRYNELISIHGGL